MNIEIGQRLLEYRKKNGLSQEELAERIGVSRQAVSKWERAEASPDTDNLIMLSKIYGVTLDELINGAPLDGRDGKNSYEEENNRSLSGDENPADNQKHSDSVSFKHGIHVRAKNGDSVDIGFNGIRVDSAADDTHVHIDGDGVFVRDGKNNLKEDHIFSHAKEDEECPDIVRGLKKFPFPVVCAFLYIIFGFCDIFGGWSTGWIIFMTIPLYYTLIDAVYKKNAAHFAYPVLAAMIYMIFGLVYSNWHPSWIVFLTVPLYYFVCDIFKK